MTDCGYVATSDHILGKPCWDPYQLVRYTTRSVATRDLLDQGAGRFWVASMRKVVRRLPSGSCVVIYVVDGAQEHVHALVTS